MNALRISSTENQGTAFHRVIDGKPGARIVLGSALSCDLRLDHPSISPIHAVLEWEEGTGNLNIYDLASEGGVFLNGVKVVQAKVAEADVLRIGTFELSLAKKAATVTSSPLGEDDVFALKNPTQDIFDHRPEVKTALQVVMLFKDTILNVSHFVGKKKIVLGPKSSDDLLIPPQLSGAGEKSRYELLSGVAGLPKTENNYTLNLHQSMRGVLQKDGKMRTLTDITSDKSESKMIPLGPKDFAKIEMGDVSFFLSYSPAPPRLKAQKLSSQDPFFTKVWLTSLVVTLFVIFTLSRMEIEPIIEIEQLPERIATIIYKPELLNLPKEKVPPAAETQTKVEEKKPEVVKPQNIKIEAKASDANKKQASEIAPKSVKTKTLPKKTKAELARRATRSGQEGAGARAKGEEGSRGKPDAKLADNSQTKAKRPGAAPANAPAVARQGKSQVQDLGVVDVLRASGGTLNKLLAGGKGISASADKLEGYGGFTTRGAGGQGAAGSGAGGGGVSEGLGGLADKGLGGGKQGKGLGALGSGGNMIGGSGRVLVDSRGGGGADPIVMGGLDEDAIAREIERHRDEIKYCYEKEINVGNPGLSGRVTLRWVIGASGAVGRIGIVSSSLRNANVEGCVSDVIKRIVFPPVKGGGTGEVTYPFVFRPSGQ